MLSLSTLCSYATIATLTSGTLSGALSSAAAQGVLTTTVIGDAQGFGSVSERDILNHGRGYWVEPRTASFARIEQVEAGRRLVHNGVPGPVFPVIAGVTFSPDGSRLAYVGRTKEGERLVVDGAVLAEFGKRAPRLVQLPYGIPEGLRDPDQADFRRFGFSPDGQHLAWVQNTGAADGPGYRVMLDGEPVSDAERIAFIAFAPTGGLVWSTSSHAAAGRLTIEGVAGPELIGIDGLEFSGASFVYYGTPPDGGARQYLVNHEVAVDLSLAPYAGRAAVGDRALFSPDHAHAAVLLAGASEGDPVELFLDGESLGAVRPDSTVAFDPAGRLFRQRVDGVVLRGEAELGSYGSVGHAVFAPVGDRLWFFALEEGALIALDERGERLGPFEHVSQTAFSADGAHSTFVTGERGSAQDLFVDGHRVLAAPGPLIAVRFASRGDALFVEAPEVDDWSAAIAACAELGVRLVPLPAPRVPPGALSPDGRLHAWFEVVPETSGERTVNRFDLVINDEPTGESFDQAPAVFGFGEDGVLRFVTRRGTDVLRAEYRP